MYSIKISYATGNSFGSSNEDELLDLTWKNLDIAKENLLAIKEHYDMYQLVDGYSTRAKKEQHIKDNKDKAWFVNNPKLFCTSQNRAIDENQKNKFPNDWEYKIDEHYAVYCLKLKADNGNMMQISAFWCGYFETLYEAEIVATESDMKISFY